METKTIIYLLELRMKKPRNANVNGNIITCKMAARTALEHAALLRK